MILTCENCHTRYLVPSSALAPDGRRVRCSQCEHEWYQEYEEDEGLAGDDEAAGGDDGAPIGFVDEEPELEPIPEGVRPLPEGSNVPARGNEKSLRALPLVSVGAAGGVFIAVFLLLVILRGPILSLWPQSGVFYSVIGMEPPLEGKDLILDKMQAKATDDGQGGLSLAIDGRIVNLGTDDSAVPKIQAMIKDESGANIGGWTFDGDDNGAAMQAGDEKNFHSSYADLPDGAKEVAVRFVMDGMVDEAALDNPDAMEGGNGGHITDDMSAMKDHQADSHAAADSHGNAHH